MIFQSLPHSNMHRIFQTFIERLQTAEDVKAFSEALTVTMNALDLPCFAYLALPCEVAQRPRIISSYPVNWVEHYAQHHYQLRDPVITHALATLEPFTWGLDLLSKSAPPPQQKFFDEASAFGIRFGYTIPIHDGHGPVAALTFAADNPRQKYEQRIGADGRVLQLMAMYFHALIRRKLSNQDRINGVALSRREFECLEWAAQGKSAWEIARILGISRNTVAYYLENAKEKLGVRTIAQAVTCLAAANKKKQNLDTAPPTTTGND